VAAAAILPPVNRLSLESARRRLCLPELSPSTPTSRARKSTGPYDPSHVVARAGDVELTGFSIDAAIVDDPYIGEPAPGRRGRLVPTEVPGIDAEIIFDLPPSLPKISTFDPATDPEPGQARSGLAPLMSQLERIRHRAHEEAETQQRQFAARLDPRASDISPMITSVSQRIEADGRASDISLEFMPSDAAREVERQRLSLGQADPCPVCDGLGTVLFSPDDFGVHRQLGHRTCSRCYGFGTDDAPQRVRDHLESVAQQQLARSRESLRLMQPAGDDFGFSNTGRLAEVLNLAKLAEAKIAAVRRCNWCRSDFYAEEPDGVTRCWRCGDRETVDVRTRRTARPMCLDVDPLGLGVGRAPLTLESLRSLTHERLPEIAAANRAIAAAREYLSTDGHTLDRLHPGVEGVEAAERLSASDRLRTMCEVAEQIAYGELVSMGVDALVRAEIDMQRTVQPLEDPQPVDALVMRFEFDPAVRVRRNSNRRLLEQLGLEPIWRDSVLTYQEQDDT